MNPKIKEASKKFDVLSNTTFYKAKYLPNWLIKKSKILTREYQKSKKYRRYYSQYKNGSIIMVDFGINIGNELCNNHFAVVLNKNDNKMSSVLSVLPISSKDKKYYYKLNDEVFKLINEKFEDTIDDLNVFLSKNQRDRDRLENDLESINHDPSLITPEIQDLLDSTISEIEIAKNEISDFLVVRDEYKELANDSFACVMNIQTISKERIRKINPKDPSGAIRLSKNTMDGLDKEIIKYYTNYKI